MSRIASFKAFSVCLSLLLLAACSSNPTGSEPAATSKGTGTKAGTYGSANFSLQVGKVGALSKSSTISMKKLVLTAVAGGEKPDTVRDTSTLNSGYDQQTVKRVLKLKPKSSWVLYAKTLDAKDSVIHSGSTSSFSVKINDTTHVSLELKSKFTMFQATFKDLPYSIGFGDERNDRVGVAINRLVMKVDGVAKRDSTQRDYFSPTQTVALGFDYVSIGKHDFTLEAYGVVSGIYGLLYTGTINITTVPGEDGYKTVTMTWVGPIDGGAHANIIIGKVGTMELKPNFPDKL